MRLIITGNDCTDQTKKLLEKAKIWDAEVYCVDSMLDVVIAAGIKPSRITTASECQDVIMFARDNQTNWF